MSLVTGKILENIASTINLVPFLSMLCLCLTLKCSLSSLSFSLSLYQSIDLLQGRGADHCFQFLIIFTVDQTVTPPKPLHRNQMAGIL